MSLAPYREAFFQQAPLGANPSNQALLQGRFRRCRTLPKNAHPSVRHHHGAPDSFHPGGEITSPAAHTLSLPRLANYNPSKQTRDRGLIVTPAVAVEAPVWGEAPMAGEATLSGHPAKWHRCTRHPTRHATRHRCSKHSTNAATHATQPRHHGCQHCASSSHAVSPPILFLLPSVPVLRNSRASYVAGYGSPKNTLKACDHRA